MGARKSKAGKVIHVTPQVMESHARASRRRPHVSRRERADAMAAAAAELRWARMLMENLGYAGHAERIGEALALLDDLRAEVWAQC